MKPNPLDFARLVAEAQALDELEANLAAHFGGGPVDAGSLLEFFEVPSGDSFDVAPAKAIEFFKAKGLRPTFSYADMLGQAHAHAFTIAKMMDVDMLGQVRASLDSAFENGTAFKEWADSIIPILQSGGWWGRKEVLDPLTGQPIVAQLGSPWRLETIFRTNMQSAYAAGHWQEIAEQAEFAPFLMYDAVDDLRTRPLHKAWDQTVLPVSSQWWKTHFPPNGYNCRCGVIQLDAEQVKALGLTVDKVPPDDGTYTWTNPRTGEKVKVPNGLDPGFDHNPGQTMQADAEKLLADKIANLPAGMKAAARAAAAEAKKLAQDAIDQATVAQQEAAAAAGQAALKRAQALAAEKSKQWTAKAQLDAIAKGKETAGKGAAYKIKALQALKKSPDWLEATPVDQLAQVLGLADELKFKQETSSKLSLFKKAVLEGKTPAPSLVKALDSLPEADKAAFLKSIDEAKAAAEAKKAAELAAAKPAVAKTVTGDGPPNPATMQKVGEQKGSNPGGTYLDTSTNTTWYVKQPASAEIARNEVLAAKLYELAGVEVPELHLIELDGKASIASKIVGGLKKATAGDLAAAPGTAEGFAVDAWLSNWDVVGLGYDNLLLLGSRAFRVDTGGALRFRAQGGLKGSAFGPKVTELESLRDASLNRQAQSVFGRLTPAQIEDSVVRVLKVRDEDIRALVDEFGPLDAAERRILADTMIARKRDLAQRFPEAARRAGGDLPPPKESARVTAAEQAEVEASRVNGYAFPTDSDQIEDNLVLVHAFKRVKGEDATRGFLKLLPTASAQLRAAIKASGVETDAGPAVSFTAARDAVLSAIKSINFRADKGQALDTKVLDKIEAMKGAIAELERDVADAVGKAASPDELKSTLATLKAWAKRVEDFTDDAKAGKPATKIPGKFPVDAFPDSLAYSLKAAKKAADAPAIKWKRVDGPLKFKQSAFDRSFATETAKDSTALGVQVRYEAELPDGTRIVYVPHEPGNAWAVQGILQIDTPGRGVASTSAVFDALGKIGVKSTRATEADRQILYLNAFARIRLTGPAKRVAYEQFASIKTTGEQGVADRLAKLKAELGIDVTKSEGWKTVDGVRQAFGHGRAYQLRPDLTPAEVDKLGQTHVVFHNPQGLGTDAGAGVFERLKVIIDGGGMFASLTDRIRRGVPLQGSSVSADLQTGGGDYLFTRIRSRTAQAGKTGVYWRTSVLRRMDAITYDSDNFGRTTGTHVLDNRKGQTVDGFKEVARSSSNETIFKGGLSIFDEIDRIVLKSKAEVDEAIAWLRSRGYKAWPDGRKLEEVVITAEKHSAKP